MTASSPEASGSSTDRSAAKSLREKAGSGGTGPARKKAVGTRGETTRKTKPAKKPASARRTRTAPAVPADDAPPAPSGRTQLPEGYVPSAEEEYMGPMQLEYFRLKLLGWRQSLYDESEQTIESMREQSREVSDEAERASRETEMNFELRARDRYRKLIHKINQALSRIEDGSYGYCEETGDPIGLGRLEARPIATLSVEAQERREMLERQYRP